jgi:cytosine permease
MSDDRVPDKLDCGRSVEELSAYLEAGRQPYDRDIETCPDCLNAIESLQRVGQLSALSAFVVAATLGFSMSFWDAFWAITIGAVILEVVCVFTGLIGQREGLNTSILSRWTGFGHAGSAVIGLAIGVSLIGWFGIQSGVSASGLHSIMPWLPVWAWSLAFGLLITAVVMLGFHGMQWVANVAVPLFLLALSTVVLFYLYRIPRQLG